jgi:hypothetical protein
VAAPTHRQRQVVVAREVHGRDDVGGAGTAGDQGRRAVDQAIPDSARRVEAVLAGPEHRSPQARQEALHHRLVQGEPAGRDPLLVPLLNHDQSPTY